MPDPTKEEFQAAAAKVAASAPPGLSRKEFFDRVEGELNRGKTLNAPSDYWAGVRQSAGDTLGKTATGVGEGVVSALNPINLVRAPYELGKDILTNKARNTGDALARIIQGDPEAGGQAIGGLLVGGAAPRIIPKIPSGMVAAGEGLERAGTMATPSSLPLAVADAVGRGSPKEAIAIAAAPYAAKGVGRILQKAGGWMKSESPYDRYMPNQSASPETAAASPTDTTAAPSAAATPSGPIDMRGFTVDDHAQFQRLMGSGHYSPEQAMQQVILAKSLAQRLGTPSTSTMQANVDVHNATGRWPE